MQTRLIHKISFITDSTLEGTIVELSDPTHPRFLDVRVDGFYFGTVFACGVIPVQHFQFIGAEPFGALKKNLGDSNSVAAKFVFRVPDYVNPRIAHNFQIVDRETQEILFEESRTLRSDFDRRMIASLKGIPLGRLMVKEVLDAGLVIAGTFTFVDTDGLDLLVKSQGSEIRPVINESGATTMFSPTDKVKNFSVECYLDFADGPQSIELSNSTHTLNIMPGSGLSIPQGFRADLAKWIYPESYRMERTMGFASNIAYYFDGFQTFRMLDATLCEFTAKALASYSRILDWGCGCGRVTQHLINRHEAAIYGADIDSDTIQWCARSLPGATFLKADLLPPLEMPSGSFDLIFGLSVFTHLDEFAQDAWLAEIARLLEPDGIAVMSIHSENLIYSDFITSEMFEDYLRRGISDSTVGNTLKGVLRPEDFSYYRETFHSHNYVASHWGRTFDILGISRGAHNGLQDSVVLRKRS